MSKGKFISKIKEMFSNEENITVSASTNEEVFDTEDTTVSGETKEAFLDVTTDEGVMVRISEPVEVGSTVEVIDEEGEVVGNAPDGEHLVEGIRVIVLDGLISEIIQPEQEEVVEEEEVVEASTPEVAFATEESVNELKTTLEEMKSLLSEREEVINGLIESFSKFSKQPNEEPTKKETKFSDNTKSIMSKEDKIKFFSNRKRK